MVSRVLSICSKTPTMGKCFSTLLIALSRAHSELCRVHSASCPQKYGCGKHHYVYKYAKEKVIF